MYEWPKTLWGGTSIRVRFPIIVILIFPNDTDFLY